MLAALAAVLAAAAGCTTTVDGHGTRAVACGPVFLGVPGSGQGLRNPAPGTRPRGISADDARRYGTTVARVKDAVQAIAGRRLASARAVTYPAIPVSRYIGATGLTAALETSELAGVAALVGEIRIAYRDGCQDRPVLLAGYSQGAEVVVRAVGKLSAAERRHVTIALLGNPSYRPGLPGDVPAGSRASGLRPTFENGDTFSLDATLRRRTIDVCAPGDPVCGVDPDALTVAGRLLYVITHARIHERAYAEDVDGFATAAARFLWAHRTG